MSVSVLGVFLKCLAGSSWWFWVPERPVSPRSQHTPGVNRVNTVGLGFSHGATRVCFVSLFRVWEDGGNGAKAEKIQKAISCGNRRRKRVEEPEW